MKKKIVFQESFHVPGHYHAKKPDKDGYIKTITKFPDGVFVLERHYHKLNEGRRPQFVFKGISGSFSIAGACEGFWSITPLLINKEQVKNR